MRYRMLFESSCTVRRICDTGVTSLNLIIPDLGGILRIRRRIVILNGKICEETAVRDYQPQKAECIVRKINYSQHERGL